jgi:hypothetical protein
MSQTEIMQALALDEQKIQALRHYAQADRMTIKTILTAAVQNYLEQRRVYGLENV